MAKLFTTFLYDVNNKNNDVFAEACKKRENDLKSVVEFDMYTGTPYLMTGTFAAKGMYKKRLDGPCYYVKLWGEQNFLEKTKKKHNELSAYNGLFMRYFNTADEVLDELIILAKLRIC